MRKLAFALLLLPASAWAQVYDTSGREKVNVETGAVTCAQSTAANLKVDGSDVTQPVSGTVTCNVGTGTQPVSAINLDVQIGGSDTVAVDTTSADQITPVGAAADGAAVSGNPLRIAGKDGSGNTQDVLTNTSGNLDVVGNVTANAGTNLNTSALLTTSAHDAAFGTAGSADAQVRTIQGVASMTPVQISHSGAVQQHVDPCSREARIPVTINLTANTQLATGTASERIYICSFWLITATAQNIALVSGTGSTCGTSTSGVVGFGGNTAATGQNYAANGGAVLPAGASNYGSTDTDADNLCLFISGSGQVSGGLTYVSAPSGL